MDIWIDQGEMDGISYPKCDAKYNQVRLAFILEKDLRCSC